MTGSTPDWTQPRCGLVGRFREPLLYVRHFYIAQSYCGLTWDFMDSVDPIKGVANIIASQILPFYDPTVLGAWLDAEKAVYDSL
jgi:hypothetical protein